jgi:hypothetical protein
MGRQDNPYIGREQNEEPMHVFSGMKSEVDGVFSRFAAPKKSPT